MQDDADGFAAPAIAFVEDYRRTVELAVLHRSRRVGRAVIKALELDLDTACAFCELKSAGTCEAPFVQCHFERGLDHFRMVSARYFVLDGMCRIPGAECFESRTGKGA